jgi:Ca2+/Na+ antiporter
MMQNIILITLIIMLIFFLSNEEKINDLISKKYTKYLFILLIVYFIYQNYNFTIIALVIIILIFLNVNIKEKFENNSYLENFNIDNFKKIALDYYKLFNSEVKKNKKVSKELFKNKNESFDFNPFIEEKININNDSEEGKPNLEPFKNSISEIKELYNNIKEQINKLN